MNTPLPSTPVKPATRTRGVHLLLPIGIALLALLVSLVFFSPRLWAFAHPMPGSSYWDRGLQFMLQVEDPFGAHLKDAGLTWRLAPALLAHGLGLNGRAALVFPWLGLLLLLTFCAALVLRRTGDHLISFLTTTLLGTTSAVLTVTGWLGLNDAWYASALLAVAFLRSRTVLVIAVLVGPWIDERFILALPLALWVRAEALGRDWRPRLAVPASALAILLYTVIRVFNLLHLPTDAMNGYRHFMMAGFYLKWLPWAGLGWFMGLRAVWMLIVVAVGGECRRADWRPVLLWPAILILGPMLAITLLSADSSRTTTMLLPLVLLGVERLIALRGIVETRRVLAWLLVANLLLPAMQVTHQSGDIINLLPIEFARWISHP